MIIIIIGGVIIWARYEPGEPLAINRMPDKKWDGTVYIGGGVNLPGYYPFTYEDTIETLVQAAGGASDNASFNNITLLLNDSPEVQKIQKININRAEKWLLEALPGIGEVIAQRIIDYRMENGNFTSTLGLLEVDGIGTSIYEDIKSYITVAD